MWILAFCESLVENVPFGMASFSVFAKVSWKCSFWKFGVLTFCWNFMENVYFGGLGFTGCLTVAASRSTSTTRTRTTTAATTTTGPPLKMFTLPKMQVLQTIHVIIHHLWHLHRPCTSSWAVVEKKWLANMGFEYRSGYRSGYRSATWQFQGQ